MDRLSQVAAHVAGGEQLVAMNQTAAAAATGGMGKIGVKNGDDVVIVAAYRTAITKGSKGGFKDTNPEEMLTAVLSAVTEKANVPKNLVDDIQVGNCRLPGSGVGLHRMAAFAAGFPTEVSVSALNRACSSGLQALANIAGEIKSGSIDIGIGAGVESMTMEGSDGHKPKKEWMDQDDRIPDCLLPMGITSENVAKDFNVGREKQDQFSLQSYQKALRAQEQHFFDEEIVPVKTKVRNANGTWTEIVVDKDDGVRATTIEGLRKLRPAFRPDGFSTAGNSSQVSDGAAAVLLARRSTAEKLGLPILGKMVAFATAGVPPRVMGIGPAYAIPKALQKAGITKDDVDIYEINEAFASQAIMSIDHLGIDYNKVNPKGGAIAMGHPLGCTGARQISTLFTELKRTNKKIGVTSMCIGGGQGAAAVFERE